MTESVTVGMPKPRPMESRSGMTEAAIAAMRSRATHTAFRRQDLPRAARPDASGWMARWLGPNE